MNHPAEFIPHIVLSKSEHSVTARNLNTGEQRSLPADAFVSTWFKVDDDGKISTDAISVGRLEPGDRFFTGERSGEHE